LFQWKLRLDMWNYNILLPCFDWIHNCYKCNVEDWSDSNNCFHNKSSHWLPVNWSNICNNDLQLCYICCHKWMEHIEHWRHISNQSTDNIEILSNLTSWTLLLSWWWASFHHSTQPSSILVELHRNYRALELWLLWNNHL
jgi:hypothetical protein